MKRNNKRKQFLTIRALQKNGIINSIGKYDEDNEISYIQSSTISKNIKAIIRGDGNGQITITDLKNFILLGI